MERTNQITLRRSLGGLPLPLRWGVIGAIVAGVAGGTIGLILGLLAHPPTAWFAIFEVGLPAAFVGVWIGVVAGGVALGLRRARGSSRVG